MDTRMIWIQLVAVMVKEVRQTVRDRRVMFLLLVAPMVQLIVFSYAVNFEVDDVPTVVVDRDDSAASRRYVAGLLADGTLTEVARAGDEGEAERMVEADVAKAAIIIPRGLSRDLARGRPAQLQVVMDGTDPTRAGVAAGAVSRYFGEVALDLALGRLRIRDAALGTTTRVPGVRLEPRIAYNPRLVTAVYMVPGIAAMLVLMITTIVTAMGLAREREMGTLEQVLVTPIRPAVLMVGKLAPYVVVGLLDVALALTVGAWVFEMPIRGDLTFLFGATALYLMSTLGIGLFISTASTSQQQAFMGGFLFILPAVLLSGNMTPIHSMPDWLQPVTWLNPLRWYIEIVRGNLLRGAGAADLWPQLAILAVMGTAILVVASMRFRKTVV